MIQKQRHSGSQTLGKMIAQARLSRSKTQYQLADLLSTQQVRVSHWERGERRVPHDQLSAIEEALNVKFFGVHRLARSPHHPGNWCQIDLVSGRARVICNVSGETIWPVRKLSPWIKKETREATKTVPV